MKFYNKEKCLDFFGRCLYFLYLRLNIKIDIICSVPVSRMSLLKKGYNHAALLAMSLYRFVAKNKDLNKPLYLYDLLLKYKESIPQRLLDSQSRLKKKHTFLVNKKYKNILLKNKNILIIDDVMTTGSTVDFCARILKKYSKCYVCVITLTRSINYV
jgi:competence protein ComFC